MADLLRSNELTPEIDAEVENLFQYHPWDARKQVLGGNVRSALTSAVKVIIANVPPCPTRSVAIRKLVETRMECNAAITHDGKY